MKYTVITGQNINELIDEVNNRLHLGWEPLGGVQFDRINLPAQAMINREVSVPALLKPVAKTNKGAKNASK
jgi:hypothetical protein